MFNLAPGRRYPSRRPPPGAAALATLKKAQSVMVRAEHRNRGIGAALMAAILAEAEARGLEHVTVHSGRRAVDFYLRNGFGRHRQLMLWEPSAP
ncbi:GNAT family N-acetyltransferase [Actinoplanes sp. NPDC026623]|uniref:GNAT family N-acetyltransferase n=1 Tax=Actinoplanes sp. NPDC026623 TaxID=3155610 RepID=UPI00340F8377